MKKQKGFTLVELLVVIAILAILATVSIVGYSAFIKKANQSADEQAVTQMNTVLQANEVLANKTIQEVYSVFKESGLNVEDYKPIIEDRYFFWDSTLNRILYVEVNGEDYSVLYPENCKNSTKENVWYSLSGLVDTESATYTIPTSAPSSGTTTLQPKNGADFAKMAEYFKEYQSSLSGKTLRIELTQDLYLNGADIAFTENNDDTGLNVELIGNGHTIYGLYISDEHSGSGAGTDGIVTNTYGCSMFGWVNNLTVENLTIVGANVGTYKMEQAAIFASHVSGDVVISNVNIMNSTIYSADKSGLLFGFLSKDEYSVDISNVTITNSSIFVTEGESGLLFGVVTGASSSGITNAGKKANLANITIDDKSCVNINPASTTTTIGGKLYVVTSSKYKQASATYGFIGLGQGDLAIKYLTDSGLKYSGKSSNWKAINTVPATITTFNEYTEK